MMDLQTIHGCIVHRVQTLTGLASLLVSMTHALQNEVDAKGLTRATAMTVDKQAVTVEEFNKYCRVARDELTMADMFKLQLSVSVRSCSAIAETFETMVRLHEFLLPATTTRSSRSHGEFRRNARLRSSSLLSSV